MEEREITSPIEIAETFNNYFSNVGDNLAEEIEEHDSGFYLKQTEKSFLLQYPSVGTVFQLLSRIGENKSVGLDNIPNKLLKIAADVIRLL